MPTFARKCRWGFVHITQCRGFVTNGSNHWILHQGDTKSYLLISVAYWWAPIRAKQLSVTLPSLVGWLGRWSLVATNRSSCPPGHRISFYWPGQVGVIAAICHKSPTLDIRYKSPSAYRALSHALTVSLYLFLLKPQDDYCNPGSCALRINDICTAQSRTS